MSNNSNTQDEEQDELLALLSGKVKTPQKIEVELPTTIQISKRVYDMSKVICDLVKQKANKVGHEWNSFLLADRNDPYEFPVATEIILPENQNTQTGYFVFEGEMHAKATKEIEALCAKTGKDFYSIGWMHSHAGGPVGFSQIDSRNNTQLLNTVGMNTEKRGFREIDLITTGLNVKSEDGKIIICGKSLEDVLLEFKPGQEDKIKKLLQTFGLTPKINSNELITELLKLRDFVAYEPEVTGFGYAVVVNDKGDKPHGVLGLTKRLPLTKPTELNITQKEVNVEIIDTKDKREIDVAELKTIVEKRILTTKPFYKGKRYRVGIYGGNKIKGFAEYGHQFGPQGNFQGQFSQGFPFNDDESSVGKPYSYTPSTYTPPKIREITTTKQVGVSFIEEIISDFLFQAASYITISTSRNTNKYAGWLSQVLMKIPNESLGLKEAIVSVGELYDDQIHTSKIISSYDLRSELQRMYQHISARSFRKKVDDEETFMNDFREPKVNKNDVLEYYVPQFIEKDRLENAKAAIRKQIVADFHIPDGGLD